MRSELYKVMYVTRRTIKLCYFDYYQEGC